jgi:hypothetical protein
MDDAGSNTLSVLQENGARSKLKVTAIQTGTGNPPMRLIASPQNIGTLRRRLGVIFGRERTGPHPINAYLIEHPEGLYLWPASGR